MTGTQCAEKSQQGRTRAVHVMARYCHGPIIVSCHWKAALPHVGHQSHGAVAKHTVLYGPRRLEAA